MISQVKCLGAIFGVTQLCGVPRYHATAASIFTGSTPTLRTWGSSHLVARGTGNGKTRSTEPQSIPSQERGLFCRFSARSAASLWGLGIRRSVVFDMRLPELSSDKKRCCKWVVSDGVVALSFSEAWSGYCMRRRLARATRYHFRSIDVPPLFSKLT